MLTNPSASLLKPEAARELKICVRHLEHLMKARAISYMKIGRATRFTREALDAFKASRTIQAIK